MKRSTVSRRLFLMSTGAFAATGEAAALDRDAEATFAQATPPQTEDGIVCHEEMHEMDVMKGFPPPRDKRVTWQNWSETTARLRYAHLNPAFVFRTVPIERGDGPVWVLPRKMLDRQKLHRAEVLWGETEASAGRISVREWLNRSQTDALVALHDGHIVAEVYCGEMTPRTPHIIWCGSKAVLATVLAPFLVDGTLDEGAQVTHYFRKFGETAFNGATIRDLLDQMTGVRCDDWIEPEEFAKLNPVGQREWNFGTPEFCKASNDYARSSRALGMFPQLEHEYDTGYYDFLLGLVVRNRPHRESFRYSDYNSMALQLILERVTGTSYVEHLSRLVRELGFERNATLILDPIGTPIGNYGLALTARDWARWGEMLCSYGQVGSGRVLPGIRELVDDIVRSPGAEQLKGKWPTPMPNIGYRSQFWTAAGLGRHTPLLQGRGWCLQRCVVDLARKNVVVQLATFWDQDPDIVRKKETPGHGDLAIWSFVEEVLPKLIE
jgi:CubicO group peptidase (beta-lactamase class C family)